MIELEHSPLGGSGAKRWLNCAGSFLLHRELLEQGEFEDIGSEYADIGTAAHELAAMCLENAKEPWEYAGWKIGNYTVGEEIDPVAVGVYVNECESLYPRDGKGTVLIEATLSHPEVHPYLKGTIDFGYWRNRVEGEGIWLRDYKNGEGVGVKADRNEQLLYYGFLAILEFNNRQLVSSDIPMSLGIVQPNFYGIFGEVDVWETTLGEVLAFGHDRLVPRMKALTATQDVGESDFKPGEWCQFCLVMLECPKARQAYQVYVEGMEFLEMASDAELNELYRHKELARKFMNQLEKVVYARMIGGKMIESAKLVDKKANRTWKDGAEPVLSAVFGEAAYKKELLSPAAIEKLSSRGKELAVEFGYMPEASGLTVAPIDDPRPAVKPPSSKEVFAGFAQTDADWKDF